MKKDKKNIVLFIIEILFTLIFIVSFGVFGHYIFKLNVVPAKYLTWGGIALFIVFVILLYFLFSKNKKITKGIAMVFIVLFSVLSIFGTKYLKNTYDFFQNTKVDYDTLTYSVLVLKDSNYNEIGNLQDKEILYIDDEYKEDIVKELTEKISYEEVTFESSAGMAEALLDKEIDAIVLEASYIGLIKEEVENFDDSTKYIYTFEVKVKAHEEKNESASTVDITMEPFILYISGIDQYGNVNSVRGRSDVNQLAIVNPKTNHILLVNTPRDFYVQLAGTTGLRDKLTHAGIYGIDKSIKTLENLYGVDITHYLRVNFNTVIKVVDVIGGIDIESDSAFTCFTDKRVHVQKGWNHFSGSQALAYARERFAYTTGDHHRGANQQQVITAIINKVTNSKVLISKYNSILSALDGSFQTDMPMEEITSFIRYQIDKMPAWNIESIAVTGSGSMDYTYSMGTKIKLYVMEPNMSSVNTAKKRINEVLNEG